MEEIEPTKNIVAYLVANSVKVGKKEEFSLGGFGYSYTIANEGKKKLKKDVATTTGFYTGNNQRGNTVVVVDDILTLAVSNRTSLFEVVLNGFNEVLTQFVVHGSEYKNLYVVTPFTFLGLVWKLKPEQVEETGMTVGRYELLPNDYVALREVMQTIKEFQELKDRKVFFDNAQAAEGGLGNKSAFKQYELAEVMTVWGKDKEVAFGMIPRKQYEEPESDFNKLVCASRWYIDNINPEDFYTELFGYRRYGFGKVEPDKNYYGKQTPDVTYSTLYTKTPITFLDKLYDFAHKKIYNPDGYLLAGDLRHLNAKEVKRMIDTYPAVKEGKDLVSPVTKQNGKPVLIELISPVLMSYRIRDDLNGLNVLFQAFLKKDENNRYGYTDFYDITDMIYVKEKNKKDVVKVKLNPEFNTLKNTFLVKVKHPKAVKDVALLLSVGYDMPDRNSFNAVEDPEVKVWVATDTRNDQGIRYCTIVETSDSVYIQTSAVANLKVLSLAEQGRSKEK